MRRKRKLLQKALAKIHSPCYNINLFGGVAHLGERDIRIVEVTGSSPAVSTIQKALKPCGFGAFFFCGEDDKILPSIYFFYILGLQRRDSCLFIVQRWEFM